MSLADNPIRLSETLGYAQSYFIPWSICMASVVRLLSAKVVVRICISVADIFHSL